jgi:hypothetical protein
MRRFLFVAFFSLGVLPAQWITYPTPGVPRLKNGSPNLNAPAPRTADGYPDFSGLWGPKAVSPLCPNGFCVEQMALPVIARNIATGQPGDALPYQPWAAEQMKQRVLDASKNDPHTRCTPPNFPRAWALPQYRKILQTPGLVVVLHEFNASYRQIHTDARPLPKDMQPIWNGYSTGHWEGKGAGQTLVVHTEGFRDDSWLDMLGNSLSSATKVTERIRRPNFGTLEVEVTIDDPKTYTKPWTVRMDQVIVVDTELLDEICLENEKDVGHLVGR